MSSRRTSVVAGVVLAPVLLIVGGIAFTSGNTDPATPGSTDADLVAGQAQLGGDPVEVVAALEERVERLPEDDSSWAALGFAYVAQARTTGDPTLYDRAEEAFAESVAVRPDDNTDAVAGQAALANARHDFAGGRDLAQQAVESDPYDATALGNLADAQLALGEYDRGFETLQQMVDLRPGVPSFTRVSYGYELRGDVDNAREVLERALEVASNPFDAAFCLDLMGQLAFDSGEPDRALELYERGLAQDPESVDLLAGRAAAHAAVGDADAAVEDYAALVERSPQAAYLVEFAELLMSLGRSDEAADQLAVARAISELADASGVVPDVEVSLFEADHGDPDRAVEIAEANARTRSSVQVEDALAWALHADGRHAAALEHAEAAQALGTRAALWDYHRGMIQLELGMVEEARESLELALATNPDFSRLHAPRAREALTQIGTP